MNKLPPLSFSLHDICRNLNWHDGEFNKTSVETFNSYRHDKFSQLVRIFNKSPLVEIAPDECDLLINTLLRDTDLFNCKPNIWKQMAEHLINVQREILKGHPVNNSYYKNEYARFMVDREKSRDNNTAAIISKYNEVIINWRFK